MCNWTPHAVDISSCILASRVFMYLFSLWIASWMRSWWKRDIYWVKEMRRRTSQANLMVCCFLFCLLHDLCAVYVDWDSHFTCFVNIGRFLRMFLGPINVRANRKDVQLKVKEEYNDFRVWSYIQLLIYVFCLRYWGYCLLFLFFNLYMLSVWLDIY